MSQIVAEIYQRRGRSRQHLQTHQVEALAKQADERDRQADERDRRWFMRNVIASGIVSTPSSPPRTRGALSFVSRPGSVVRGQIRVSGTLRAVLPDGAYLTADGDILDEICWRRYGREDAVPAVLAANPRLADAGPVLAVGGAT